MDGWQAVQNWAIFCAAIGGLAYYYYPKNKSSKSNLPPVKAPKKDVKKPARKTDHEKLSPASIAIQDAQKEGNTQNGNVKRKTNTQPALQTSVQDDDHDDIDMSTRQFAANLQKAREGIQVKSSNKNEARVKTVKPKNSPANTPILSSGSSQADGEEDRSPAVSPALRAGGIDDMLEPAAPGPSALRITASEKPMKEKATKQPKKEVAETKKQRQNRKKVEERRLAREAEEKDRSVALEQQRRTARESRGEPAKNGIPIAPAPTKNPWTEQNAARDAHLPAVDNTGNNVQLLDTLDTESNSSSNQEASTAATSVVADAAPSRWADDDYARAVEESERESGWNEVKSSKKTKKTAQVEQNGTTTPVVAPTTSAKAASAVNKQANGNKPIGYQALVDEGAKGDEVDSSDPSAWAA